MREGARQRTGSGDSALPCEPAAGADTRWGRQGCRQEAASGERELIPLLNPCLNGATLEGVSKAAKRQALHCLIPTALDFQRDLSMQKGSYSTEATRSQQSPFLTLFSAP